MTTTRLPDAFDKAMKAQPRRLKLSHFAVSVALILAVVAAIYWPLHHSGLVWVDKTILHDEAWLRHGDAWKHFMLTGFYGWVNYFRPLVVALLTLEVRLFDGSPGSMHMVSVGIHQLNTLLVGLLARRLCARPGESMRTLSVALAMAIYGLHPASIEPVAWISCQFDLVVTLFMLLGLLLHVSNVRMGVRACSVALCFFLAACAKESAISMPALLVLADLTRRARAEPGEDGVTMLQAVWRSQRATYFAVVAAGIAYLFIRHWALGFLTPPATHETLPLFARLQTVCFTYLSYLRIIVWPMVGLSPIHVVDSARFLGADIASIVIDVSAIALLAGAVILACRRKTIGFLLLAVTAALFPALHIIPVAFDPSLFHERYAMAAIAMVCVWLPGLLQVALEHSSRRIVWAIHCGATAWLILAAGNIVVTLPLWSDEMKLWEWVLQEQPDSIIAKDHLLATYMGREPRKARELARKIVADKIDCATCLLNIAHLAVADRDIDRAESIMKSLKHFPDISSDPALFEKYVLEAGRLRELEGKPAEAEQAYRRAMALDPYDPIPVMQLALLFARQGRAADAKPLARQALQLSPPDLRWIRQRDFEQALASPAAHPANAAPSSQ